jgi:hypothetical protein
LNCLQAVGAEYQAHSKKVADMASQNAAAAGVGSSASSATKKHSLNTSATSSGQTLVSTRHCVSAFSAAVV